MQPIICKNDLKTIVDQLQEYVQKGRTIGGIRLVDQSDDQVVLLIGECPIDQNTADVFWSGWQAALG